MSAFQREEGAVGHRPEAVIRGQSLAAVLRGAWLATQARRAASRYKCLCPLHDERTPSFTIDAEKNLL